MIRVLAIMEASSVTGPAKNLIRFCQWTRTPEAQRTGANLAITIATFCRDPDADGSRNAFVQAARSEGIDVQVIREGFAFDRRVFPRLRNVLEIVQPNVVQTHNVKSGFIYSRIRSHLGVPWIAFQHGYTAPDLKMRVYNQLDRITLRSADRVVTVCQAFAPALQAYGVRSERIRILHNSIQAPAPVPENATIQLRRELGLVEDDTVILAVGRLSKEKGHADLLQALSVVRRDIPEVNWKLVLVGTGPEQAELDRLSAKLGLTDRVVMAGFRPTVASFFAIAGLFVLPSHSEGSSNVLLEAMAARLPIVATRAGGTPEIAADEKTALLVDSRNAMANAVRRFLTDGALRVRLADAAYAHAIAEFSPDRYRASLVTIYQDALSMAQSQAIPLSSTG